VEDNDGLNGYIAMRMTQGIQPFVVTFDTNHDGPNESLGFIRRADIGRTREAFASEVRTRSIDGFTLYADGQTI